MLQLKTQTILQADAADINLNIKGCDILLAAVSNISWLELKARLQKYDQNFNCR